MKEFLTEWLIRYGTEWVGGDKQPACRKWQEAARCEYIERAFTSAIPSQERITTKGLEYIKDEKQT